ncbi:S1C family serine protease [Bacillus taeanensis]|uniref:Serine protease n=1 Tax=Bacillus taeanensis TaxID=273032 RepID=A0A366XTX1_9BACI|nr:S1C family serine protease [Bacillus taeanensis]RBW69116.1 serine protease [Bacillus taeanensis]
MGYYDEDYTTRSQKQKGNRGGWFLAGLLGAILGAFLILISVPALSEWGLLPNIQSNEAVIESEPNIEDGNAMTQTINVDVNTDITKAVEKAKDSVVGVINLQQTSLWEEGYGEAGSGSGVIYKKEGENAFVVTNHHVVEGANQLEISLSDGTKIPAELIGSDPLMDLAVLRVDGAKVNSIAQFGSSEALKPGEPAIAIGNPLGFLEGTVTQGIVSNPDRTIPVDFDGDGVSDWQAEVIQTDASINPGNSGGALINIAGQVIGINSSKIAQEAVEGIGFSIPINIAEPIITSLEQTGKVERPFIGVNLRSLSEVPTYHWNQTLKIPNDIDYGIVVMSVVPNSPAQRAGMEELDVITELDGQKVEDVVELRKYLYKEKEIGEELKITFYRNGEKQTAALKLTQEQGL